MICTTCKAAATLNRRGRNEEDWGHSQKAEETFEASRGLHEECKGCYCQCVVGERLHD